MNYYAVLYTIDGHVAKSTKKKSGSPPIVFKDIGFFQREADCLMTCRSMLKTDIVVQNFVFHVKQERWCLYNEVEFDCLIKELGLKNFKKGLL